MSGSEAAKLALELRVTADRVADFGMSGMGGKAIIDGWAARIDALAARPPGEGWLMVPGWEGVYEVHACGAIRKANGHVIGQSLNDQGYALARLSDGATGRREVARVHRLVAQAFVPNPSSLPFVNHIDNNRSNSDARNLEWCTQAENLAHMTRQGRRASPWAGKRSPSATLSDEQATAIRADHMESGASHSSLAKKHGTSKRTVGRILNGEHYV